MNKIKSPSVAGKFYSNSQPELTSQLNKFEMNAKSEYKIKTRALIVPHAGYIYSGQLALEGIKYLDNPKNIFIFAPSHHEAYMGIALSEYEYWATPLGDAELNQKINEELKINFNAKYLNKAFEYEHAAEVQVPIIQYFFPDAKIIPVLIGNEQPEQISEIIEHYWKNKDNSFIISSDLSHFLPAKEAGKIDLITAQMIEEQDIQEFKSSQACGAIGIAGLVDFASQHRFSLIRTGLINSSDASDDESSVVGYGCWILYEDEKNKFIKTYFTQTVLDICKRSIESKFTQEKPIVNYYPQVFDENGACFVTIEKNGNLRGCIGSIIAHRTLISDLITNAQNAAFSDPRFKPLQKEELEDIDIFVSLLSRPEKIKFSDERDLLSQIKPFEDGLIVKDGYYQAVYLPSVWEQLPDKKEFLTSLKLKAGLAANHFSKTFEAFRFHSEYIKSK